MTPTKADSQYDRLLHAFGYARVQRTLENMVSTRGRRDPLQHLTDDARDELMYRLISDFKFDRKIRTENRRRQRERVA